MSKTKAGGSTRNGRDSESGVEGARQILWRYAVQNNYSPDKVPEDIKKPVSWKVFPATTSSTNCCSNSSTF